MAGLLSRLGRKQKKTVRAAVVVAAGSATRMEGIDKVLTPLADVPVLVRTLRVFQNCDDIDEIVVVTREDLLVEVSQLCKAFALDKVSKVVVGGKSGSTRCCAACGKCGRMRSLSPSRTERGPS